MSVKDATCSDLSNDKYRYDFVVSTTQASINSGLMQWLNESSQPYTYLCWLVDVQTDSPGQMIPLQDLLAKTGGVNPFDIPAGTPTSDPRIQTLTSNLFKVGVKIRPGIPQGVAPQDFLPVVDLGNSANNVTFRMYCSEIEVIENVPPVWGASGAWNVWSQGLGQAWYAETIVDLVMSDLDAELKTPYFDNHTDQKNQILAQLNNNSSTAFSLQQLLFDLDNAALQNLPKFGGIPPGSSAEDILQRSFSAIWSTAAKSYGQPLVAVTAVSQDAPDPSQIKMTSFEREVSQYKGSDGTVPSPLADDQKAVTTLNYLCMTQNHVFPGVADFNWNWVQPQDIGINSGIISISRQIFGQYLLDNFITPHIENCCMTANVDVTANNGLGSWSWEFTFSKTAPQTSQVTAPPQAGDPTSGELVINVYQSADKDDGVGSSDSCLAFHIKLVIIPHYTCQVTFQKNTITIVQRQWVYVFCEWDSTGTSFNAYDVTLTDVYDVSVDQYGNLQIQCDTTKHQRVDASQGPDRSGTVNFFTDINDVCDKIKSEITGIVSIDLSSIQFTGPKSFIFPGAKVFTYNSPTFSDYQDLICNITYVDPDQSST